MGWGGGFVGVDLGLHWGRFGSPLGRQRGKPMGERICGKKKFGKKFCTDEGISGKKI